jgi:peptide/nickel transport system substrate-binding protein
MNPRAYSLDRRALLQLLGIGGGALLASGTPSLTALAQSRKGTLVIGIDFSDITSFDPAREEHYTGPMTGAATYETLVTVAPGDYANVTPALAKSWVRTPDGKGWRFNIRENVKFVSGRIMTADDVVYSLNRVIYIKEQPAQYLSNVASIEKVDDGTVDVILKDPAEPILLILSAPNFSVCERKVLEEHGSLSTPEAKEKDKATDWLNQNSAGTGAYRLVRWERNSQIQLVANPHYWRGKPPFERIIIRHFDDGSAQLLALRRGDIDAAFNLIPEQIKTIKDDKDIWVTSLPSFDFVYMALTQEPDFNKPLTIKAARQAVGYAIDYDGIKDSLLGGAATRPATFLPVGVAGSTETLTREIGFRQDIDKSRKLLAEAGLPDGFEYELTYGNGAVNGSSFHLLAQKIQSDLARVGIKLKLSPMPQVNVRTLATSGKLTAVLTFFNPPAVETELWAAATVERMAKRIHWTPPDTLVSLIHRAASETDPAKQIALWKEYQLAMIDQANLIMLFQPIYQIGVRRSIKTFPLTAAGWQLDMFGVTPA